MHSSHHAGVQAIRTLPAATRPAKNCDGNFARRMLQVAPKPVAMLLLSIALSLSPAPANSGLVKPPFVSMTILPSIQAEAQEEREDMRDVMALAKKIFHKVNSDPDVQMARDIRYAAAPFFLNSGERTIIAPYPGTARIGLPGLEFDVSSALQFFGLERFSGDFSREDLGQVRIHSLGQEQSSASYATKDNGMAGVLIVNICEEIGKGFRYSAMPVSVKGISPDEVLVVGINVGDISETEWRAAFLGKNGLFVCKGELSQTSGKAAVSVMELPIPNALKAEKDFPNGAEMVYLEFEGRGAVVITAQSGKLFVIPLE